LLHNGRPTGPQDGATTERGAYTLDGETIGGLTISRNPEAKFWIPSEDEWYKAAYHDPRTAASGGPDGDSFYWLYPMMTNVDPGNIIGALPNQSNFFSTVYSVTQNATLDPNLNYLSAVGSYSGSASFSGTFDQGGNVYEWTDAVVSGSDRRLRGGSWLDGNVSQHSSNKNQCDPAIDYSSLGFRVASP
jgi:formylglycine-generating enzyme required for sulfatase activity